LVSAELALSVACRGSCAAIGVGFLEQLVVFERLFGPRGPASTAVSRAVVGVTFPRLLTGTGLRWVLIVGSAASVLGAVVGPYPPLGRFALATVLTCVVIVRVRRVTGGDGAEQMATLTLLAACVALLPNAEHATVTLAVWFIGGQSLLSYATAGIAKAMSPTWIKGDAVPLIMGSEAYGQPWASGVLGANPRLAKLLTRSVIAFECCFPLILVAPKSVAIAMFFVGAQFHAGCAITMGLNAFLFVFPASYVCVAYVAQQISPFW
jgi:hypothetical protein